MLQYLHGLPWIGSTIRELMHPNTHGNKSQSLAEAIVLPGETTFKHYHVTSEEIYHVTEGEGIIWRGNEEIKVTKGDTVFFPPGVHHYAINTGSGKLRILCFMTPPYTHGADSIGGTRRSEIG